MWYCSIVHWNFYVYCQYCNSVVVSLCVVVVVFFQDKCKLNYVKKIRSTLNLIAFSPRLVELFPSPKFTNDLFFECANF